MNDELLNLMLDARQLAGEWKVLNDLDDKISADLSECQSDLADVVYKALLEPNVFYYISDCGVCHEVGQDPDRTVRVPGYIIEREHLELVGEEDGVETWRLNERGRVYAEGIGKYEEG